MYPLKKRQWSWGTGEAEEGERARDKAARQGMRVSSTHDDIVDYSLTRSLVSFCVVGFFPLLVLSWAGVVPSQLSTVTIGKWGWVAFRGNNRMKKTQRAWWVVIDQREMKRALESVAGHLSTSFW